MSDPELIRLVKSWNDTKRTIKEMEERLEDVKNRLKKALDKAKSDQLKVGDYTVSRRNSSRTYLGKSDVPKDIWDTYSGRVNFEVLTVKHSKKD